MSRQKVVVEFGADARAFNREMYQIRKRMAGFAKMAGAGLAAAAAGYVKLLKSAVEYGDGIDKASARTGIGAEALQRLSFAAELSGANIEGLEKGIKRMSSVVIDAEDGLTEAIRAMDDLGVSMDDVKGKTPEQQLMIFMDALAGVEDAGRRSARAQDIFGKAGTQLLPMLRDGATGFRELLGEADKVNGVLGQDLVSGAAKLKDSMSRVGLAIKALAFREVLTDAENLADKLDDLSVRIGVFGQSDDFRSTVDNMRILSTMARGLAESIASALASLVSFGKFVTVDIGGQDEIDRLENKFFSRESGGQKGAIRQAQLMAGTGTFGATAGTSQIDNARALIKAAREAGGLPVAAMPGGAL